MKTSLIVIILLLSKISMATVLEIAERAGKVYYHPTPTLTVSLIEAGGGGGALVALLDYDPTSTRAELEGLKLQFPNYQVEAVSAEAEERSVTLDLPILGLNQELQLHQGQMGPNLSANFNLSAEQVKALKKSKDLVQIAFSFKIRAKADHNDILIKEKYEIKDDPCLNFTAKNVSELILNLTDFKRPAEIKFDQTFVTLKFSMVNSCSEIAYHPVRSLSELMNLEVVIHPKHQDIVGVSVENKAIYKFFEIIPQVKLEIEKDLK